ncbi:cysteine hydrolase family protein [Acidithiobacillus caldus]
MSPGLIIIDLQQGFSPSVALIDAIAATAPRYHVVAMTRFVNRPDSLYRSVLGWNIDPGDLIFQFDNALILDKTGYGLSAENLDRLRETGCTEWHLCGLETDACILACAFSLWDAGLRPKTLPSLCSSPLHKEGMAIAERQFGPLHDGNDCHV